MTVPDSSRSNSSITKSAISNGTIEVGDVGWSVLPEREFNEVYKNNKVE